MWHTGVLKREIIDFLNCCSDAIYVDVTLGGGDWAEAVLEASKPNGKLVGFDRDASALEESSRRLKKFGDRLGIVKAKFSEVSGELERLGIRSVDGIIADLGVSSHQLDEGGRGFSFSLDGKLDMRMDADEELSAYHLVNQSEEKELADWFFEFGEERFSRRIARSIVYERKNAPIETTKQLADLVARAVPGHVRRGKIHPATRVFQALRIVVNNELGELKTLIKELPGFLKPGGRFVIASYHSLEDRIVKHKFVELAREGGFKRITKKPIRPTEEETRENRRARSARLRVLERA